MSTKIILTIEDNLTDDERDLLRLLLQDAFWEFAGARTPATHYVETRYPVSDGTLYPEGPRRGAKIAQVQARINLAHKLKNAVATMEAVLDPPREFPLLDSYAGEDGAVPVAVPIAVADVTKQYRIHNVGTCLFKDGNGGAFCNRNAVPGTTFCRLHTSVNSTFKDEF